MLPAEMLGLRNVPAPQPTLPPHTFATPYPLAPMGPMAAPPAAAGPAWPGSMPPPHSSQQYGGALPLALSPNPRQEGSGAVGTLAQHPFAPHQGATGLPLPLPSHQTHEGAGGLPLPQQQEQEPSQQQGWQAQQQQGWQAPQQQGWQTLQQHQQQQQHLQHHQRHQQQHPAGEAAGRGPTSMDVDAVDTSCIAAGATGQQGGGTAASDAGARPMPEATANLAGPGPAPAAQQHPTTLYSQGGVLGQAAAPSTHQAASLAPHISSAPGAQAPTPPPPPPLMDDTHRAGQQAAASLQLQPSQGGAPRPSDLPGGATPRTPPPPLVTASPPPPPPLAAAMPSPLHDPGAAEPATPSPVGVVPVPATQAPAPATSALESAAMPHQAQGHAAVPDAVPSASHAAPEADQATTALHGAVQHLLPPPSDAPMAQAGALSSGAGGGWPALAPLPPAGSGQLRLQVQVVNLPNDAIVPDNLPPEVVRRPVGPPPPEVIVVSELAKVRDVRHAATRVLSDVYRMFRPPRGHCEGGAAAFEVTRVVGGLPQQVGRGRSVPSGEWWWVSVPRSQGPVSQVCGMLVGQAVGAGRECARRLSPIRALLWDGGLLPWGGAEGASCRIVGLALRDGHLVLHSCSYPSPYMLWPKPLLATKACVASVTYNCYTITCDAFAVSTAGFGPGRRAPGAAFA